MSINVILPEFHESLCIFVSPPDLGGIYVFKSMLDEVLYVGKATSLRERIRQHIEGKTHTHEYYRQFFRVEYFVCESPLEREIYETYAINVLSPKYNVYKVYEPTEEIKNEEMQMFIKFVKRLFELNKSLEIGLYTLKALATSNGVKYFDVRINNELLQFLENNGIKLNKKSNTLSKIGNCSTKRTKRSIDEKIAI